MITIFYKTIIGMCYLKNLISYTWIKFYCIVFINIIFFLDSVVIKNEQTLVQTKCPLNYLYVKLKIMLIGNYFLNNKERVIMAKSNNVLNNFKYKIWEIRLINYPVGNADISTK